MNFRLSCLLLGLILATVPPLGAQPDPSDPPQFWKADQWAQADVILAGVLPFGSGAALSRLEAGLRTERVFLEWGGLKSEVAPAVIPRHLDPDFVPLPFFTGRQVLTLRTPHASSAFGLIPLGYGSPSWFADRGLFLDDLDRMSLLHERARRGDLIYGNGPVKLEGAAFYGADLAGGRLALNKAGGWGLEVLYNNWFELGLEYAAWQGARHFAGVDLRLLGALKAEFGQQIASIPAYRQWSVGLDWIIGELQYHREDWDTLRRQGWLARSVLFFYRGVSVTGGYQYLNSLDNTTHLASVRHAFWLRGLVRPAHWLKVYAEPRLDLDNRAWWSVQGGVQVWL